MVFHNYAQAHAYENGNGDSEVIADELEEPGAGVEITPTAEESAEAATEEQYDVNVIGGTPVEVQTSGGGTKITCKASDGICCYVYTTRTVFNLDEGSPSLTVEDEDGNILFEGFIEYYELGEN